MLARAFAPRLETTAEVTHTWSFVAVHNSLSPPGFPGNPGLWLPHVNDRKATRACVSVWAGTDESIHLLLYSIRSIFPSGLPVEYSIVAIMRVRRTTKKERWYLWQIFDQSGISQVGEVGAMAFIKCFIGRRCFKTVLGLAVVYRGRWRPEERGVFLPESAEEHSPLHVQESQPTRAVWSSVAQAEHFCAEQHSLHLHGLQARREETDRWKGRRRPRRAHGHRHTSGERTARRRMFFSLTCLLIYVFYMSRLRNSLFGNVDWDRASVVQPNVLCMLTRRGPERNTWPGL